MASYFCNHTMGGARKLPGTKPDSVWILSSYIAGKWSVRQMDRQPNIQKASENVAGSRDGIGGCDEMLASSKQLSAYPQSG